MLFKRQAQATVLAGRKLFACLLKKGQTVSASACENNLRQKTVINTVNKIPENILCREIVVVEMYVNIKIMVIVVKHYLYITLTTLFLTRTK